MGIENLLVRLSMADSEERVQGLSQIVEEIHTDEVEPGQVSNEHPLLVSLEFLLHDRDPDIRRTMVAAWMRLGVKRINLEGDSKVESLLEDVNENVRESALRYMFSMAKDIPGYVDFAFIQLCRRVNDIDIGVRVEACEALGQLKNVKLNILLLSLDKQSKQEKDWCEAGAFVIALEDQFMRVRLAAIASLTSLSLENFQFAEAAKSLIIDTFNDETEEVRLLAVKGLTEICKNHRLAFDITHLESALCLLDDGQEELRAASRLLLKVFPIPDEDGLLRSVRCLNAALKKYPEDSLGVAGCLNQIGFSHSDLVSSCAAKLLKLDRFFMNPEPRIEDQYYGLKMILLYSAAGRDGDLARELPIYAQKHHSYFRLKYGDSVPSFRHIFRS